MTFRVGADASSPRPAEASQGIAGRATVRNPWPSDGSQARRPGRERLQCITPLPNDDDRCRGSGRQIGTPACPRPGVMGHPVVLTCPAAIREPIRSVHTCGVDVSTGRPVSPTPGSDCSPGRSRPRRTDTSPEGAVQRSTDTTMGIGVVSFHRESATLTVRSSRLGDHPHTEQSCSVDEVGVGAHHRVIPGGRMPALPIPLVEPAPFWIPGR